MNMLPTVNVKAINSMQSKIADADVNISKLWMTKPIIIVQRRILKKVFADVLNCGDIYRT